MRKLITSILMILSIMFSIVSCSAHKYDVKEIEEKLNVTSLESREVYCGEDWEDLTYYFTLESDRYSNVYFYLFDSSSEATEFYDYSVNTFDSISTEEDNYTIGDMYGGEVVDRMCIFVSDNLVVYINMESEYFSDMGEHSTSNQHDMRFVQSFVDSW